MNVLLVSQCSKNALKETRRILDQFAERRGERTWQTSITQAGLDTLRKLLRSKARKNTAVACHWIRGHDHSELMWVVGDASQFNTRGATPTNTTRRNILRTEDENDWHTAEDIRLLAQMAALLHDLGKGSVAFQDRLDGKLKEKNLYRHEWVSLRLFLAFVGLDDDEGWLQRLADRDGFNEREWIASGRYQCDGLGADNRFPFRDLPPLAAAIAWLIVSHHRLPVVPVEDINGTQERLGKRSRSHNSLWLEEPLSLVAHDWNEIRQSAERAQIKPYWKFAGSLPMSEPRWREIAARLARHLLALRQRRNDKWLSNPYVMHLARLSLMLADHYYSGLGLDKEDKPVWERKRFLDSEASLMANTTRDRYGSTVANQSLNEHLLGVTHTAGLMAHALPGFERYLPRLANHRGLRKRSKVDRFRWQDKAADAATALRESARENGAFIVNMASTGCGKTLANARILYALADPQQGMRATYALGLRTLTLQTGRSYRTDLHLGDDELAVQVGGSASRSLFEFYEEQAEAHGSASVQNLIEEDSYVLYEGVTADHPLLSRAMRDSNIRKLLSAPILTCTVDHMVPATESLRAGRQIAPMLRLMSSDLILDELDDYDLNDLPALTRLVHWAGMLGTRVVLSSATLPPSLVTGMYQAYRAGRQQYRQNRGRDGGRTDAMVEVPCLWTDEFGVHTASCSNGREFLSEHNTFVGKRATQLINAEKKSGPLRRGAILPLTIATHLPDEKIHAEFARQVREACLRLHQDHAEPDPVSGKQVSFGLVRMANIDPLFDVAQTLFALGAPDDTRIHLCVYHARFPLVQRSAIEYQLDAAFNRRGKEGQAVYELPGIRSALDAYPEKHHLFIVLASPVCEVGRDWDADWAVAEPSSMRSLIQLAGRVQRHRGKCGDKPNMLIFDTNLKHFKKGSRDGVAYIRPGFEKTGGGERARHFQLSTHRLSELLTEEEYRAINALPRVFPRPTEAWQPNRSLVDLEQARTATSMLPPVRKPGAEAPPLEPDAAFATWKYPSAALTGVLPQQQPFRDDPSRTTTLAFLPDDEEEMLKLHRIEDDKAKRGQKLYLLVEGNQRHDVVFELGERIGPWGDFDLMELLAEQADYLDLPLCDCAKRMATVEVPANDEGWRYHPQLGFGKKR